MKHIKTFESFVNEATLIAEGSLSDKAGDELSAGNWSSLGEIEFDKSYEDLYPAIADALGNDINNVMFVDSETNDEDALQTKIYDTLQSKFSASSFIETKDFKTSNNMMCQYDAKLNVVYFYDYGFQAYYFTTDSKF